MDVLRTIGPDRLRELRHVTTLVVDVEPLLVAWSGTQADLDRELERFVDALGPHPRVVFVTNSARRPTGPLPPTVGFVSAARKPLTRLGRLAPPVVVVGDQPLTDGLLAWRHRATYLQNPLPAHAPLGVRVQRWCGGVVLRVLRFPVEPL
jgi:predicted HAD superfamily phosphohydrolase YqeG